MSRVARVIAIASDLMIESCVFIIVFPPVFTFVLSGRLSSTVRQRSGQGEVVLDSAITRVTW